MRTRRLAPWIVLPLLAAALGGCPREDGTKSSSPSDAESARPRVEIVTESGRRAAWIVELARTAEERERGLMGRTDLAADAGMLFVFPYEEVQHFWMKDTPLPLDMIFISSRREVAGVVAEAKPFDTTTLFVDAPSQYVLEVNGGQAARHGIAAGSKVFFHDIDGL